MTSRIDHNLSQIFFKTKQKKEGERKFDQKIAMKYNQAAIQLRRDLEAASSYVEERLGWIQNFDWR
jgi:hypothetical protein